MREKIRAEMEAKKQQRIVRKTEIAAEKATKAQRKAARELKEQMLMFRLQQQQQQHEASEKPKRARKPNRPKAEIEAEKVAKAQRKAARQLKKQTEHEAAEQLPKRARKPNRPKPEIEAEKAVKAQRKAAREEKRLANALQFAKKALEAAKDNHSIQRSQESRTHLETVASELSQLEEHHATISNGNARAPPPSPL